MQGVYCERLSDSPVAALSSATFTGRSMPAQLSGGRLRSSLRMMPGSETLLSRGRPCDRERLGTMPAAGWA